MSALDSICTSPLRSSARDLDDALARLDAIGAGIHPERAADRRRECRGRNGSRRCRPPAPAAATRLSGVAAPALMRVGEITSASPKPLAESRTTKPGMPPSRTSRFEPMPTMVSGMSSGTRLEERREILLVGRLEQRVGEAAGAEPGDLVHLGIGRHAAAQAAQACRQACRSRAAPRFMPASRRVPWAAHRPIA